jgi:hypothetical protein
LGIPLACLSAACTYDNGDARRILNQASTTCADGAPTPVQTWIDVNQQIGSEPGKGAGVFIEYAAGGHWSLRTTCDFQKSNTPCAWDIIVTPEDNRSISNVQPEDLESNTDSVLPYPDYPRSIQLLAETSDDVDGVTFDTEPQSAIQVDALLDGVCALPYFFWVGDGAAHTGSPSNPLVLVPTPE